MDTDTENRVAARVTFTTDDAGNVDDMLAVDDDAIENALTDLVGPKSDVDAHVEVRSRGDPLPEEETTDDWVRERPTEASKAHFEVYEDRAGEFRWRLVHDNGNVIADSGEGYATWGGAENGLRSVKMNAPDAPVERL